ncbi:hypothetical protein C7H62_0477 [Mesoflavibacter sp. HG96]|uniref:hypothetical protein n=1 Tax=unclassified Mesoflavibacter TaxID=2630131 RepID=UPI000D113F72|nr:MULTISPECIES: hypothetical protein [unclassified Mesoflavibacter]QIJ88286.1 hypothetical protein C7H62_0477 [Mesoflavibacter sp. HG96]QIJ91014.1 hypothetical protein C7H56_0477 [Mesoflavibacter sp. HG37]
MEIKKDRKSTTERRTVSGGGKGRKPRDRKGMSFITGGNPRKRNKKWILKRRNDRFRVVRSDENTQPKETELKCQIYLDTNDDKISEKYYQNLLKVLEEQDFILSRENPAEKGSWLKKFWVKSKKTLSSPEVLDRLEKIERGIELKHIDKVQSEVDLNTSQAISNLLESTKDIPNFSTLVGSLLFAKATVNGEPIVFAQTLTQDQLKIVKENPSLINKPFDLINKMEEVKVKVLAENKQKKLAGS